MNSSSRPANTIRNGDVLSGHELRLEDIGIDPGPERIDLVLAARIGLLQPLGDERIDAKEFFAHRDGKPLAGVVDEGIFPKQRIHLQFRRAFAMKHLNERQPQDRRQPGKFNPPQIDRASPGADQLRDQAEMAKQRHEELPGQRGADAAGGFARLLVRIMQDRQEIEAAAAECQPVKLPELQVARRIHADEEQVGVSWMKRDEVADVGLEAADFFAARIERMDQADLIARLDAAGVARSQRQGQC